MKIYKYRSLAANDFENTFSVLNDGQIFFTPYEKMNDPFEYSYRWTLDADSNVKIKFWTDQHDYYREALSGKTEEAQLKDIKEWEEGMSPPKGHKMLGVQDVGVFCCSGTWEVLPMWSLYADSHRGVCFEFETDADDVLAKVRGVNYTDEPGAFNLYRGFNAADLLTRKYVDWTFEKEFRVFLNSSRYRFAPKALSSVIFGAYAFMDSENRKSVDRIMEITKKKYPNTHVHRALRRHDGYKLELTTI